MPFCPATPAYAKGRLWDGTWLLCQWWGRGGGNLVWIPDPSGRSRKSLGNNLARKCLAGMPQFLNSANFPFRSSSPLVRHYSNFQNFYVLPYIHFLSLVELKCWLADVVFFPLSTAAFQCSRHFQARFFPRPQTLPHAARRV